MTGSNLLVLPPLSSFHYNSPPNNQRDLNSSLLHNLPIHPSKSSIPSILLREPSISPADITPPFFLHNNPSASSSSHQKFQLDQSISSSSSQSNHHQMRSISPRSNPSPSQSNHHPSNYDHPFDPPSKPTHFTMHSSSVSTSSSSPFPKKSLESSSSLGTTRSPLKVAFGPDSDRDNRKHVRVNNEQLNGLIQAYESESMPTRESNHELAKKLGMSYRRVQVWFQNRRAKDRRIKATRDPKEFFKGGENPIEDESSMSDQSQEFTSAVNSLSQIGRAASSDDERSEVNHEESLKEEKRSDSEEVEAKDVSNQSMKTRVGFLIS